MGDIGGRPVPISLEPGGYVHDARASRSAYDRGMAVEAIPARSEEAIRAVVPGSWLMLAVGEDRQHGGNDGYDDSPFTHYSWDDTVPNHGAVRPGDRLAIWNKRTLLGISTV